VIKQRSVRVDGYFILLFPLLESTSSPSPPCSPRRKPQGRAEYVQHCFRFCYSEGVTIDATEDKKEREKRKKVTRRLFVHPQGSEDEKGRESKSDNDWKDTEGGGVWTRRRWGRRKRTMEEEI
jgi:hypothetical protein